MLGKVWANAHASFHVLLHNLIKTKRQKHKIVLVFSAGLECVRIGCSCGKTFFEDHS